MNRCLTRGARASNPAYKIIPALLMDAVYIQETVNIFSWSSVAATHTVEPRELLPESE